MNVKEALDQVIGIATLWGENQEEGFPERVSARTTDEECARIAEGSEWDTDDVKEVRNLWLAIEVLYEWQQRAAGFVDKMKEDLKI